MVGIVGLAIVAVISGAGQQGSSAFTAARWRSNGRACQTRTGGAEMALPSWQAAQSEDWLGRWAMNLMQINVSTRRFGRAVRLPEGDIAATAGSGVSKSAVSRRFVALSAARMSKWMAADLSQLDLLAIQIDGMHVSSELTLLAAIGIDREGAKHPLGLLEGATVNAEALLDNLIERGLDTKVCRLFIVDGSKALIKAVRRAFGRHTPIQRHQVHKARNIVERLPKHLHAEKAERLIRNLARRLEQVAPSVVASILEGLDEMLTVIRLGLPEQLRRSLASTNIIENIDVHHPARLPQRVKRWRDASACGECANNLQIGFDQFRFCVVSWFQQVAAPCSFASRRSGRMNTPIWWSTSARAAAMSSASSRRSDGGPRSRTPTRSTD